MNAEKVFLSLVIKESESHNGVIISGHSLSKQKKLYKNIYRNLFLEFWNVSSKLFAGLLRDCFRELLLPEQNTAHWVA